MNFRIEITSLQQTISELKERIVALEQKGEKKKMTRAEILEKARAAKKKKDSTRGQSS